MICNTCGVKNDQFNKFCTNCGEKLTPGYNTRNICIKCGAENESGNKFCTSCGFKLNEDIIHHQINTSGKYSHQRKLQHKKENRDNRNRGIQKFKGMKALWIMVGIVIGSVIIVSAFDLIFHKYPDNKDQRFEIKSSNPVIEAKVFEIASKFVCSCGTCNEESLEICKCDRAIDERQFIRNYLEQNQKPDDVVMAVANKYGWLKAKFASEYKVDPANVWNPNLSTEQASQLQVPEELITASPKILNTKATISARFTIYSAFNCPCGQCKKDELKDCNCSHPNGANEIKRFIENKLNENKYTINEIIQFVDKKFGGKKI